MEELRLSPHEWDAVIARTDGPQLVVAGPGAGKTEFLVRRAAHLIRSGLSAESIIILAFSREGALRLRDRVLKAVGRSVQSVSSSTFHSFARRLLEAYSGGPTPQLLTSSEQVALVAELLTEDDPKRWPPRLRPLLGSPTLASDTADFILRSAERSISPDRLEELATRHPDWRALPDLYRRYLDRSRDLNRIDYGTLFVEATRLLDNPEIAQSISEQFRYALVDEFQDTSPAQADLLSRMALRNPNVTAAGDPYQSIFSFRGAELRNLDEFPRRFGEDSLRIVLTTSFRVPRQILDSALAITSGAELPGAAGPMVPANHGGVIEAYLFEHQSEESDWIADQIEHAHLIERMNLKDIAVVVRSKQRLLTELSRSLERRGIPHKKPDARLVDHQAVQLVLDLAKAAAWNSREPTEEHNEVARRILLGPLVSLTVGKERDLARRRISDHITWSEAIRRELPEQSDLADLLESPEWATTLPAANGFWFLWEHLPRICEIVAEPAASDFRNAWTSFSQALRRQRERDPSVTLYRYWEVASTESFEATPLFDVDGSTDTLFLGTLHQLKGKEFEVVFIADATDDLFPDLRHGISLLDPHLLSTGVSATHNTFVRFRLQEETRFAYTAMTRARSRVVWSASLNGETGTERIPSRFLVAAASMGDRVSAEAPPPSSGPPITPRQVEALLRRTLADPTNVPAERLAAATVLAEAPQKHWDPNHFAGLRLPGPDEGVITGRLTLSPTRVERYLECPRRYVFERQLTIQQPDSSYLQFGNIVHAVLQEAETRSLKRGSSPVSLPEIHSILDKHWETADFGSAPLNDAWYRKAEECLDRLIREWPEDATNPIAVEHDLEHTIGGVQWRGRADRIDSPSPGELRIIDYKTSAQIPSKQEAAKSLQLAFYLLAAAADPRLAEKGQPTGAELWYPRTTYKGFRRSFDISELVPVQTEMEHATDRIQAEDWAPRINPNCAKCQVRIVCPLWPEGREAFMS